MASTAATYPTTVTDRADEGWPWSNLSLAETVSDDAATCAVDPNEYANTLEFVNFGFAIPSGATIDGIVAEYRVKRDSSGSATVNSAFLTWGGTQHGSATATGVTITSSFNTLSAGASNSLWGASGGSLPTPTIVNDPTFGFRLSMENTSGASVRTFSVAFARMTIYYTLGGISVREVIQYS